MALWINGQKWPEGKKVPDNIMYVVWAMALEKGESAQMTVGTSEVVVEMV